MFINKISPQKEKKWVEKNHSLYQYNCQVFVAEAVKILKPKFYPGFVHLNDKQLIGSNRLSCIPQKILDALNEIKSYKEKNN